MIHKRIAMEVDLVRAYDESGSRKFMRYVPSWACFFI